MAAALLAHTAAAIAEHIRGAYNTIVVHGEYGGYAVTPKHTEYRRCQLPPYKVYLGYVGALFLNESLQIAGGFEMIKIVL